MKMPDITERFSIPKVLAALISLLFIISVSSCTQDEATPNSRELPSDQELTEIITTQLESSFEVPADELTVETKDGIVTLNGNTSNLLAKRKAKEIAQSITGVLAVVDNLKVTATRPDGRVDSDVDRALATDPATEEWQINAEVNNGVVTLKGAVESWQERKLADLIASRVKGVKEVNNNIIVNYSGTRSDDEIRTEIERTLMMSSRISGDMVEVSVADGNVELSGAVGSAYEKSVAGELAHVTGVESVDTDQLEVHPEYESALFQDDAIASLTADEIRNAIQNALKYDPRVPEEQVTVAVEGETAILEGSVQNLNSKLAAGEDARNTAGVNRVENNITVEHTVVVTPDVPTSDSAVQERIRNAIIRDPYVEGANISITVKTGIVELKGEVDSDFEKEQIEKIAGNVKGVIAIDNELSIGNRSQNT